VLPVPLDAQLCHRLRQFVSSQKWEGVTLEGLLLTGLQALLFLETSLVSCSPRGIKHTSISGAL
jgi:hypothetical protein